MPLDSRVSQLVFQPTKFCNLDCDYCYLPDRTSRATLSLEMISSSVEKLQSEHLFEKDVDVRWHCGEPTAVGLKYFQAALRLPCWQEAGPGFHHSIQTNATLLSSDWLAFFKTYGFRVGVSLDGPAEVHDRHRKDRLGRSTHTAVELAIESLLRHDIDTTVLAVVTRETLKVSADNFYDYFRDLGISRLNLNVEESEGVHKSRALGDETFLARYRSWLKSLYNRHREGRVKIREFSEIEAFICSGAPGRLSLPSEPLAIVTVDVGGDYGTFSPELLSIEDPSYGSFVVGHFKETQAVAEAIGTEEAQRMVRSIDAGRRLCATQCEYFQFCGGGSPSNKLLENGDFESTETFYCKARFQIPTDIVLDRMLQMETPS